MSLASRWSASGSLQRPTSNWAHGVTIRNLSTLLVAMVVGTLNRFATLGCVVDEYSGSTGDMPHLLFTRPGFLASPPLAFSEHDGARATEIAYRFSESFRCEPAGWGDPGGRFCLPWATAPAWAAPESRVSGAHY